MVCEALDHNSDIFEEFLVSAHLPKHKQTRDKNNEITGYLCDALF